MEQKTLQEAAIFYGKAGFATLPINGAKRPAVESWAQFQTTKPTTEQINAWFNGSMPDANGLAVIAGRVSGNVEIIDVDCKYDLTGKLMKDFCDILKEHISDIFRSLVIAQTVNKGYHIVYRVPSDLVQGNKKLARRPATVAEAAQDKKVMDLIETRGNGGYIAVAPTTGYKWLQGTPETVLLLTAEQHETIFTIARSFDQMPVIESPKQTPSAPRAAGELSPFEDYNDRADIPALLERHGWRRASKSGDRTIYTRPGTTANKFSANFHERLKIFYVFTTSTAFESGRGFNPVQVYAQLEHGGDLSAASRRLYAEGYGARRVREGNTRIERQPRKEQSSNFYLWFKEQERWKKEEGEKKDV